MPGIDDMLIDDEALRKLTHREREIVKLRCGLGYEQAYTRQEVARMFKITRERVRQIEENASRKMKPPTEWAEMKRERDVLIEAIRNLREATRGKYTLRSLADLLGVTPTQLSRWTAKPTAGPPDFICTRGNLDD